jgi:uncharacterized protein YciI
VNYFYKLISPRPTFPTDITPAEATVMQQHVAYWTDLMRKGLVVVFGPVADPHGAFGIAVLQLDERTDPSAIAANDPAIKANAGFRFEVHPMPQAVVSASASR